MQMKAFARAALLVAAPLALAGCESESSGNVNQERIFTEYDWHYDANRDVTVARAEFRFGGSTGTPLNLSEESEITVNGQTLSRFVEPITNIPYYERTFAGLVQTGTFRFVDDDARAYSNTITLRPISFPATVGPISRANSFELTFGGPSLALDEEASVVLFRVLNEPELGIFRRSDEGAQSVILDRAQLQNVQPGTVTLTLTRTIERTQAQPTAAGGTITGRYTAVNRQVQVTN